MLTPLLLLLAAERCSAQTWLPLESGIGCNNSETVRSITPTEDSTRLLVSGFFSANGLCEPMYTVVTWNGDELTQATAQPGGFNCSLAFEFQGNLYSSGYAVPHPPPTLDFNISTEVGIWDTVPGGFNGTAFDYIIRDDIVYLVGGFSTCGGIPCGLVCSFDGQNVVPHYTGSPNGSITYAVEFYSDTMYIGGVFSENGELNALGYNKCCKIVDGHLERLMNGISAGVGVCYDLEVFDDKLYMGGWMHAVGFEEGHTIYYYQNGMLHTLPSEPDFPVTAMKAYNGGLYVAGDFSNIGEESCNRIARWDGQEWTCLSNDVFYYQNGVPCIQDCINDIEIWNDTLYIGGRFHRIGEDTLKRIAKLDMALSEAFPVKVTEQQRKELKLTIYPNPATHELTITLPPTANARDIIAVYDMHGRLVQEQRAGKYAGNITVDVSRLSGGMYVVKYSGRDVVLTQSFIKE